MKRMNGRMKIMNGLNEMKKSIDKLIDNLSICQNI